MTNGEIMMNVKKYRATTTREALELVKQDLGPQAFVLETKRVKTGGFLGLRQSQQIEVSAAAPSEMERSAVKENLKKRIASPSILNLSDEPAAAPRNEFQAELDKRESIMSALSARTASSKKTASDVTNSAGETREIDPPELNPNAPVYVRPRREMPPRPVIKPEEELVVQEVAIQPTQNHELELLRAELREVKFSLGAFANRQNANSWQSDLDLDLFGEVFEAPFYDVYVEMTAAGIPPEMARKFVADIIPHFRRNPVNADQLTRRTLIRSLSAMLKFETEPLHQNKPLVMAVIGATGVGKTTTVAKLAARVSLHEHRRVEMVTLDTYRIAAVEQLKTYAEIIGAGCHVVRSVLELDAALRRMPADATVLIDTTGRSPHDLADQYELSDYLQRRKAIRKCLAVQATTHTVDAVAAIRKFDMYGADCLAVTKMDETMRPGAVIETIAQSNLPLAYFCTGQRVPEDLQIAKADSLADRILGTRI